MRKTDYLALFLGDPRETALNDRVLNAVTALVAVAASCLAVVNVFIGNPLRELLLALLALVVACTIYVASRVYGRSAQMREPLFSLFLVIISATWFTNQGSEGSAPYIFFILFVGGVVVLPPSRRLPYLLATVLVVCGLLIVEQAKPEWIVSYLSESQRHSDVAIVMVFSLAITAALMYLLHAEYQRERERSEALYERLLEDNEVLKKVMEEKRILEGLLPICASCKSVRDDDGEWHLLEAYLIHNSEVELSHGICPSCSSALYGDALSDSDARAES